jgi:TetR/AcrR family transcriptional regulator, mexJK operon transcriptional repressor
MSPQEDQERTERREQIIEGALAVFAEKGFDRATNQDIAEAAGIGSAGLIYHYFRNKADLLHQVVAGRAAMLEGIATDDRLLDLPPREALRYLGDVFLAALNDPGNLAVLRVVMNEGLRHPDLAEAWRRASSRPFRRILTRYIEDGIRDGKLRKLDPNAAADCFFGSLVMYALPGMIFVDAGPRTSPGVMLDTVIEIFMQGMEAQPE